MDGIQCERKQPAIGFLNGMIKQWLQDSSVKKAIVLCVITQDIQSTFKTCWYFFLETTTDSACIVYSN